MKDLLPRSPAATYHSTRVELEEQYYAINDNLNQQLRQESLVDDDEETKRLNQSRRSTIHWRSSVELHNSAQLSAISSFKAKTKESVNPEQTHHHLDIKKGEIPGKNSETNPESYLEPNFRDTRDTDTCNKLNPNCSTDSIDDPKTVYQNPSLRSTAFSAQNSLGSLKNRDHQSINLGSELENMLKKSENISNDEYAARYKKIGSSDHKTKRITTRKSSDLKTVVTQDFSQQVKMRKAGSCKSKVCKVLCLVVFLTVLSFLVVYFCGGPWSTPSTESNSGLASQEEKLDPGRVKLTDLKNPKLSNFKTIKYKSLKQKSLLHLKWHFCLQAKTVNLKNLEPELKPILVNFTLGTKFPDAARQITLQGGEFLSMTRFVEFMNLEANQRCSYIILNLQPVLSTPEALLDLAALELVQDNQNFTILERDNFLEVVSTEDVSRELPEQEIAGLAIPKNYLDFEVKKIPNHQIFTGGYSQNFKDNFLAGSYDQSNYFTHQNKLKTMENRMINYELYSPLNSSQIDLVTVRYRKPNLAATLSHLDSKHSKSYKLGPRSMVYDQIYLENYNFEKIYASLIQNETLIFSENSVEHELNFQPFLTNFSPPKFKISFNYYPDLFHEVCVQMKNVRNPEKSEKSVIMSEKCRKFNPVSLTQFYINLVIAQYQDSFETFSEEFTCPKYDCSEIKFSIIYRQISLNYFTHNMKMLTQWMSEIQNYISDKKFKILPNFGFFDLKIEPSLEEELMKVQAPENQNFTQPENVNLLCQVRTFNNNVRTKTDQNFKSCPNWKSSMVFDPDEYGLSSPTPNSSNQTQICQKSCNLDCMTSTVICHQNNRHYNFIKQRINLGSNSISEYWIETCIDKLDPDLYGEEYDDAYQDYQNCLQEISESKYSLVKRTAVYKVSNN